MDQQPQKFQPGINTSSYNVTTPVYEGPLDLLLQLIEHEELDITALSLAMVTDQFLAYIHQMEVPADEISAFMVVAARLLQIKSAVLLPHPPQYEPSEENVGEDLAKQLRIYKQYKDIANWLNDRQLDHLHSYLRLAPIPKYDKKLDLTDITLADLVAAAEEIFNQEADKQALGSVIKPPQITIREKIQLIAEKLGGRHKASFDALLSKNPSRLEIVVTFLALLELVKRYRVSALQEELFGSIEIEKMDAWNENEELELEFE